MKSKEVVRNNDGKLYLFDFYSFVIIVIFLILPLHIVDPWLDLSGPLSFINKNNLNNLRF